MYKFGDPGRGYGVGVYGGFDVTEWCPPGTPATSFSPVVFAGSPAWLSANGADPAFGSVLPAGPPAWLVQTAPAAVYNPVTPPNPVIPCEDA